MCHEIQVYFIVFVVLDVFGVQFIASNVDGDTRSIFLEVILILVFVRSMALRNRPFSSLTIPLKLLSQLIFVNLKVSGSLNELTFVEHGKLFFVILVVGELLKALDVSFEKSYEALTMRYLYLPMAVTFDIIFHHEIFGLAPLLFKIFEHLG